MLMNDFYTVSELHSEEHSISCKASFNKDHDIFNGHFPGQPVVPGVCMMQMVKELLEQQFGKKLILRSTGQVKFLRLITPEIAPLVGISWKDTDSGYLVTALFKDEIDLFKLSGTYNIL
jgi:3-hydroxyacyl-[acyl-carrier-protein] dehydratase